MGTDPGNNGTETETEVDYYSSISVCEAVHIANVMAVVIAPYGSWESPISSDVVIEKSVSFKEVKVDPFQEGKKMEALLAVVWCRVCHKVDHELYLIYCVVI